MNICCGDNMTKNGHDLFLDLMLKSCSKQSQLTDCGNAIKREQKLIIGTIDYSD